MKCDYMSGCRVRFGEYMVGWVFAPQERWSCSLVGSGHDRSCNGAGSEVVIGMGVRTRGIVVGIRE